MLSFPPLYPLPTIRHFNQMCAQIAELELITSYPNALFTPPPSLDDFKIVLYYYLMHFYFIFFRAVNLL